MAVSAEAINRVFDAMDKAATKTATPVTEWQWEHTRTEYGFAGDYVATPKNRTGLTEVPTLVVSKCGREWMIWIYDGSESNFPMANYTVRGLPAAKASAERTYAQRT